MKKGGGFKVAGRQQRGGNPFPSLRRDSKELEEALTPTPLRPSEGTERGSERLLSFSGLLIFNRSGQLLIAKITATRLDMTVRGKAPGNEFNGYQGTLSEFNIFRNLHRNLFSSHRTGQRGSAFKFNWLIH